MTGSQRQSGRPRLAAERHDTPPGGGLFSLPRLAMGLFLVDQPGHHITVGSDRRQHIPLRAGQGWILPAGAAGRCEYDAPLTFLRLQVPDSLLSDVGFERGADFRPVFGAIDPMLAQFAYQAIATIGKPPSLYLETMQLAFAAHLMQVLAPRPPELMGMEDRRLRRALDYIHDNLAADLSLDGMASEAAMSRFHFVRAFTRAVGKSPLQYVIGERMKFARLLLKTTRLPVAAIAAHVGYEDVSRFGRHFRRHAGTTPAAFRASV